MLVHFRLSGLQYRHTAALLARTSPATGDRAMTEPDRILLHNSLIEANRALINLTGPDLNERSFQKNASIENCLVAYSNLLHCQWYAAAIA